MSVCCVTFKLSQPKALSVDCESQGNNEDFKHRLKLRQNAEDQTTIWLFKGEQINIHFHLSGDAVIDVLDVRYSNDGGVDNVSLSLDGKELGSFKTKQFHGWGIMWNTFESSGPIGGYQHLHEGDHILTLRILDADLYGLEVDYIRFNVLGAKVEHLEKGHFVCEHNPAGALSA